MNLLKNKNFYKFLLPSLLGIFLFVTPIHQNGELTIPIAVAAHTLLDLIAPYSLAIIYALIALSTFITVIHRIHPLGLLKKSPTLDKLFAPTPFWMGVRVLGFVFGTLIYFGIGPEAIRSDATGGLVINDLMPILVCVFFLAGLLLPLLLNFGLLDFFGALLTKVMRPVFNLPGRSAIDCVASWLGDGSIGVLLTAKQYEEGYYSKREATVIATTFSAVSITFSLVVISEVGLAHMFLPFYLTVAVAGIVAAIIIPRIPPLSRVPDTYTRETEFCESVPAGTTPARWGVKKALDKASEAPGLGGFLREGLGNVLDMWLGVLPVILCLGTVALILAEYTPVFSWLGIPFVPLYQLLGIPEAAAASQTVIVGFADMFLPSVIASGIESEMTRFVVAATSVTQLIYMSEIGSIIMGSKIPVSLGNLFLLFLERTVVTLPVIALAAHLLF